MEETKNISDIYCAWVSPTLSCQAVGVEESSELRSVMFKWWVAKELPGEEVKTFTPLSLV